MSHKQWCASRHRLTFLHQHLGDGTGNLREDIDVFAAWQIALDHAVGIDG